MFTRLIVVLLLVSTVALSGCSQGTTAQGTLYNVTPGRELDAYLSAPLDSVQKSAVATVKDEGYTVHNEAVDSREGLIEGITATGKKVRIKLARQGESVTRVKVYVGGDQAAAQALLNKIEADL